MSERLQGAEDVKSPEREEQVFTADDAISLAVALHQQGDLADAETLYGRILEAVPEHPDALHFLGVLRHQTGHGEDGAALIRRALEIVPDDPGMHNNLGNVLKELGRLEEAAEAYGRVIGLRPEDPNAHNNMGVVLKEQGRYAEAERCYRRAIEITPDHADAHANLGNVLRKMKRLEEAVQAYRKAIELKPDESVTYERLASSLSRAGRMKEALQVIREWLTFVPDHPIALHMRAALHGAPAPERATDDYVRALFDRFAPTFDQRLQDLEYRAPDRVAEAVAARYQPERKLRVLDAGCGTGLCGPLLAPFAARLVGVDLSGAMVDQARIRGAYDELIEDELTHFLGRTAEAFDLIVSADTLVYFGALAGVLRAAAGALVPDGALIFTVERETELQDGYRINPHGRYSHTERYLRDSLREVGLPLQSMAPVPLRREGGKPVIGLVVVAQRITGKTGGL